MVKSLLAAVLLLLASAIPASTQQVAITFDDLPTHGDLPEGQTRLDIANSILTTLRSQHMPLVYGFINAVQLESEPEGIAVLKAWRAAGQPLVSHSYSHPRLNDLTTAEFEADIAKNESVLTTLMAGQDWHWFRYPYLQEGETVEKRHAVRAWLQQNGYRTAQVSLDFDDYLWNDPYARCVEKHNDKAIDFLRKSYLSTADQYITVFREVTHTLYGRDISYVLLLHIGPFDAKMLPDLIALFRRRGFTFTTLPEAMKDPAYSEDPDIALLHGGTFQEQIAAARHIKFPPNSKPTKELEAACR
ncbi:MAG TPA: polysaccharide deacetylase family protein [Edaphobacter sp.]|nr:polysaccharide deacetylase family protein [Edaphobacter sp.]